MCVLVVIDWKQNANRPGKSSHVDVTSRMKFEKVTSQPKKKPAGSQLTPDIRRSLSINTYKTSLKADKEVGG